MASELEMERERERERMTHFGYETVAESLKASRGRWIWSGCFRRGGGA